MLVIASAAVVAAVVGAASAALIGPAQTAIAVTYPPPPTTTMAPPSGTTLTTKVNPALGQILADSRGMTVYTLANNGAPVLCTGVCATFWPPVTVPSGTSATAPPGVSGVSTVQNANGSQAAYQGFPLYNFSQDASPSDTNGEGINSFGGGWHTDRLPACTARPATAPPAGHRQRAAVRNP